MWPPPRPIRSVARVSADRAVQRLIVDKGSLREWEPALGDSPPRHRAAERPTDGVSAGRLQSVVQQGRRTGSSKPITVRLDDLDRICAALGCTVADLLEAEPVADTGTDTVP